MPLDRLCNNPRVPRPYGADVGERRLQAVLGLLLIGLTAFTALAFFTPAVGVSVLSLPLDLIINTGATLVAGAVAALAFGRFRETREIRLLFQSAAFTTLASVNGLVLLLMAIDVDAELGYRLDAPGSLPIVAFVGARFVAAALLLMGGYLAFRGRGVERRATPGWLVPIPALATLALIGAAALAGGSARDLLTPEAVEHLQRNPGDPLSIAMVSPGLLVVQLAIGAMFLAAAWFAYRAAVRDARPSDAFLAAGLILAAFSQVHFAVNPGSYLSLVTTGDGLRVAFYAALLAGIVVQSRADVRALREANVELARLRDADVHRALVDERARLAREVHDGLAQDLWYARLKQGRLVQMLEADAPKALAEDVMNAIDSGIADARQAVMAMRAGSDDAPLYEVLQRYLEDFADRFALRTDFAATGDRPDLPARTQAEILRVAQEALNNTRKHADATSVTVRASTDGGTFRLVVADNGRGFRVDENGSGFGLMSMRQRAELVGGRLDVVSAPRDGTTVALSVPLAGVGGP